MRSCSTTILAVIFMSLVLGHANADEIRRVGADQAAVLLAEDDAVVVLDVRTPGEFAAAHLENAENIDVDAESFRADIARLDRDKTYLVHCAAGIPGGRSERSVGIMEELGFEKIYHLDGGINAWKAAGRSVEGTAAKQASG